MYYITLSKLTYVTGFKTKKKFKMFTYNDSLCDMEDVDLNMPNKDKPPSAMHAPLGKLFTLKKHAFNNKRIDVSVLAKVRRV